MNTATCKGLDAHAWKDLYRAAICEPDVVKMDDAMCILHALHSGLKRRPTAIQKTSGFDYPRSA
jgi:hypothetical protein